MGIEHKHKLTFNMLFTAFGAFIGGPFIYGYNIGALNLPGPHIKDFIEDSLHDHYGIDESGLPAKDKTITVLIFSITTLLFALGGACGAYLSGYLSDKYGRRRAVLLTLILTLTASLLASISKSTNAIELLLLSRFIIGISSGACFACVPLYVCEIVPQHIRGAIGASSQLFITIGIFMAHCLTLEETFGSALFWPVGVSAQAIFATISAIILLSPMAKDSPKWLFVVQKDFVEARRTLVDLYQTQDVSDLMAELKDDLKSTKSNNIEGEAWSLPKFLRHPQYRWPIILVMSLNACQQLCGINVMFFYAPSLYENAGFEKGSREIAYAALIMTVINVVSTIICVMLMDRLGRRKMLLPPMAVLCLSVIVQIILLSIAKSNPENKGLAWGALVTVAVFIICFAVGLAPIPNFIATELFPSEPRAKAISIGGTTNLLGTLAVALLFENVLLKLEMFAFVPFLVCTLVGLVLFVFRLPETKDRSLESIYQDKRLNTCVCVA